MRRVEHAAAVVVTLVLGVTGITCFWSIGIRLRAAYLAAEARTVWVMAEDPQHSQRTSPPSGVFRQWRTVLQAVDQLDACTIGDAVVRSPNGAVTLRTASVSAGLLEQLGIRVVAGRTIVSADERATETPALLNRHAANTLFGRPTDLVGRTIVVDGRPVKIVGVLPGEARDAIVPGEPVDIVIPMGAAVSEQVHVVGRLRPGATRLDLERELARWAEVNPSLQEGWRWITLTAAERVETATVQMVRLSFLGGGLLLLVMAVNLAHLMAAGMEEVRKPLATRWALGATPWRLFTPHARRLIGLTAVAAAIALTASSWFLGSIVTILPEQLRALATVRISGLAFALAVVSGLVIMLSWLLPSVSRSDGHRIRDLRSDVRFFTPSALGRFGGRAYVVTIVACSFVLVVAAALVIGSIVRLARMDLGFEPSGLHVVTFHMPGWKYREQPQRDALVQAVAERLSGVPIGAASAWSSNTPPKSGVFVGTIMLGSRGTGATAPSVIAATSVGPGYFGVLGQSLLAGREFSLDDVRNDAPVVVVSEATARRMADRPEDALGQDVRLAKEHRRVIGVVRDVRAPGVTDALGGLHVYRPLTRPRNTVNLIMKGEGATETLIRGLVASFDPDIVVQPSPMSSMLAQSIAATRFLAILLSMTAALAMAAALFGIYAVFSQFAVRQRGAIAVRMAVGAERRQVMAWLLRKGFAVSTIGMLIGALASYPFSRLLTGYLFGVQAGDASPRVGAALLVLGATLIATWIPAVRVSRIEPSEVLKES